MENEWLSVCRLELHGTDLFFQLIDHFASLESELCLKKRHLEGRADGCAGSIGMEFIGMLPAGIAQKFLYHSNLQT